MSKMIYLRAMCLMALFGSALASPLPMNDMAFLDVKLPVGEKSFLIHPEYPTLRIWRYQHTNDVSVHTTCHGVGEDSAMIVFTGMGENPGEALIYDVGVQAEALKSYKGLCFWMRGDGGDGDLSIGSNWNQKHPTYARLGKFPLIQKEWKKFFVPWNKFSPEVTSKGFWFLNLKVEPATPRQAWAVIARIDLYQTETTEAIQPSGNDDPPGMIPAINYVQPGQAEMARMIPKTMAKLQAHTPLVIVAAGDSITAGAQLRYRNRDETHPRDSDADIYFALLEKRLAKHYGYVNHRPVLKEWQAADQKSKTNASGVTQGGFTVMSDVQALPDGTLPFNGLQIIGVGAGGQNTRFGYEHLADVIQYKPDLVIWAYGANDIPGNKRKDYKAYSAQAIQSLKQQGIEVVLCRPTFFVPEPYYSHSVGFQEPAAALARELNVPLVDQFGAFHARGRRYVGDLLSDTVHPNEYGHQVLASTLAAALGVPDQFVWDQPYFRAVATGMKRP